MNNNRNCGGAKDCPPLPCKKMPDAFPPQHQSTQPGLEYVMKPAPVSECGRTRRNLEGKTALVTGGDSGIGRAVAYDFVREGASVAIVYLNEDRDAEDTAERIKQLGGRCLLIKGDLKNPEFARDCVRKTTEQFGGLDILVNNHAFQFVRRSILDISHKQLDFIFRNNVYSFFYMIQYALPHLKKGASIINTASVTAFQGNKDLIDYSATKGAVVALTRSLALSLADRDPGKRGCARSDLDASHSRFVLRRRGRGLRLRNLTRSHDESGAALRDLSLLCLSRLLRQQLYDGTGAPSERRHDPVARRSRLRKAVRQENAISRRTRNRSAIPAAY